MNPQQTHISFPGKIHLIHNDQELLAMNLGQPKVLGFDTETRPSFSKGEVYKVALLQLSTDTDAYLIRLQHVTQFPVLKKILENKEIVKVGVAIHDDLKLLQKTFGFMPQGFVELQKLAKEKGLKNFGLKGMTEEVLQASLSKRSKLTNWEASQLSDEQLIYAATDAWIGLTIYRKLTDMRP
jgi:ribonuclease D